MKEGREGAIEQARKEGRKEWSSTARWMRCGECEGAIHSTNIQTAPTGKGGPPQKVDLFFRNFSGWTDLIH